MNASAAQWIHFGVTAFVLIAALTGFTAAVIGVAGMALLFVSPAASPMKKRAQG